jgi:hypothetical protein
MFRVRAVNTAADSENKIHDDAVAAQYGFRGGLVPGVTVYGYLASAAIEHFGPEWLDRGAMDVRFREPIYEGEDVGITIEPDADGRVRVEAGKCASGIAWMGDYPGAPSIAKAPLERKMPSPESLAPGTVFGTLIDKLDLKKSKMSAPLDPSIDGKAHPAVLIALANRVFVENYQLGPWIHVSSEVRKYRAACDGEEVWVRARVVDRFERKGHEFVIYDAVIAANEPIEYVRHTAIWRPRVER